MKNLSKLLLACACLPLLAWADPDFDGPGEGPPGDPAAMMKRFHTRVVIQITEELGLTEAQAIKLSTTLSAIEAKRAPMFKKMGEAMTGLRAAAKGDATAAAQVDANVKTLFDARAQFAATEAEGFATMGKDLSPQQRAKLVLLFARLHREHFAPPGRDGDGVGHGPHGMEGRGRMAPGRDEGARGRPTDSDR